MGLNLYDQPSTYRGLIPWGMYVHLQNQIRQMPDEGDFAYLQRVKADPALRQKLFFGTTMFRNELMEAVTMRMMMLAGGKRVGRDFSVDGGLQLKHKTRLGPDASEEDKRREKEKFGGYSIAGEYRKDFLSGGKAQEKRAEEAYALLINQFNAATPTNGSLFWNGINELQLAEFVSKWNTELGGQRFGQLEATTAAFYINKKFEWGDVVAKYFTEVSGMLGHAARGHVTAVIRCGLRDDSILTTTELPNMLGQMGKQLMKKEKPQITDLTIVVIEPKHLPGRRVAAFTNNEISMIPIVVPYTDKEGNRKRINSRDDCYVDSRLNLPAATMSHWGQGQQKQPSAGALKIMKDCDALVSWTKKEYNIFM